MNAEDILIVVFWIGIASTWAGANFRRSREGQP